MARSDFYNTSENHFQWKLVFFIILIVMICKACGIGEAKQLKEKDMPKIVSSYLAHDALFFGYDRILGLTVDRSMEEKTLAKDLKKQMKKAKFSYDVGELYPDPPRGNCIDLSIKQDGKVIGTARLEYNNIFDGWKLKNFQDYTKK